MHTVRVGCAHLDLRELVLNRDGATLLIVFAALLRTLNSSGWLALVFSCTSRVPLDWFSVGKRLEPTRNRVLNKDLHFLLLSVDFGLLLKDLQNTEVVRDD